MTDEPAFLAHLRENPADDTARLVYADWLDEQPGPDSAARADYLRTDARQGGLPADDPARDAAVLRLRQLAAALPTVWKADVARVPLENCGPRWEFVCPKKWDALAPTGNAQARFCSACERTVHYCGSVDEAREKAWAGDCVAVDLRVRRRPGDLDPPEMMTTAGVMAFDPEPPSGDPREQVGRLDQLREWARRLRRN